MHEIARWWQILSHSSHLTTTKSTTMKSLSLSPSHLWMRSHVLLRAILSRWEHLGHANVICGASVIIVLIIILGIVILRMCLELELIVIVSLVLVGGFDTHLVRLDLARWWTDISVCVYSGWLLTNWLLLHFGLIKPRSVDIQRLFRAAVLFARQLPGLHILAWLQAWHGRWMYNYPAILALSISA